MIYIKNAYTRTGSFNRSFNKSFQLGGCGAERQTVFIPKNEAVSGLMNLQMKNVSTLVSSSLEVEDSGRNRAYYTLDLPIMTEYPTGEYVYDLMDASGNVQAHGIIQVIGRKKASREMNIDTKYKEYGNKTYKC